MQHRTATGKLAAGVSRGRKVRMSFVEPLEPRRLLSVVYVDPAAPGPAHNGRSWKHAFTDLQPALTTAVSGETIDVAQGTYKPTTGTDQTISFQLKDGVAIYGGFAGSANPTASRDVTAYPTILSGDIGLRNDIIDNSYHVVAANGVNATAILDGFTITAGNASGHGGGTTDEGGGEYNVNATPTVTGCNFNDNDAVFPGSSGGDGGGMYNSSSSPSLSNCIFTDNSASSYGGGIYDDSDSSPTLTNCTFSGNAVGGAGGGGMYNYSSSPTLTNCTFSGNSAGGGGGMENSYSSSPTLTNCIFSDNSSGGSNGGGGIYNFFSSSPTVTNCIFVGNMTNGSGDDSGGGGMNNSFSSSPMLIDCIFSGNKANNGGGIEAYDYSSPKLINCTVTGNSEGGVYCNISVPKLTNCILWGDSASSGNSEIINGTPGDGEAVVTHSNIEGGFNGAGNINADPLFVNAADGNLELQAGSPCIDVGSNAVINATGVTTDLAGNPRIFNGKVDMGAYEFVVDQAATITSRNNATFTIGVAGSFKVRTTGFPVAQLSESGVLPAGITFHNNGNGTATLAGTPAAGTATTYILTLKAKSGILAKARQTFTLTVEI